ncbi:MAG: hypothetical protein WDN30_06485 [Pararobbsia sp.]
MSSDIDLIFVYEEEGETAGGQRKPISNHEYFTRLGKRLIAALSELTADGFVFSRRHAAASQWRFGQPRVEPRHARRVFSMSRGASGSGTRGSRGGS